MYIMMYGVYILEYKTIHKKIIKKKPNYAADDGNEWHNTTTQPKKKNLTMNILCVC